MRMRSVYQVVTTDEFRLPLAQADTMLELAEIVGVGLTVVSHAIKDVRTGKRKNSRYQVVWIDLDDDE